MPVLERVRPGTSKGLSVTHSISLDPPCEARLDGTAPCPGRGWAIVRFRSHGCARDGRGVVLCRPCLDWISLGHVECSACNNEELFIVSTVKL